MKKISIISVIMITILLTLIDIWPKTTGIVLDSVTGEPIKGIAIEQKIGYEAPIGFESNKNYRFSIVYTNDQGEFSFLQKIGIKLGPLFNYKEEMILTNHPIKSTDVKNMPINDKYFYNTIYCSNSRYSTDKCEKKLFSKRYQKIFLTPKVESASECQNNNLCLELNSRYLVLKEDNIEICKKLEDSIKITDIYYNSSNTPRNICYFTYAVAKVNPKVCLLISNQKQKEGCVYQTTKPKNPLRGSPNNICQFLKNSEGNLFADQRLMDLCRTLEQQYFKS